ncbi:MAG: OmpW family outer membrane protein [Wenzhouxiangella sp.]|jgi:outer membrane protein|nr:OmpW family outer membrane protein [Wenzhouxiangella sp.]
MKIRTLATFAVAGLFSANVMADAGDWLVRVGSGYVSPDTDSGDLVVDGSVLAGAQIDVGDNARPIVELTYMTTDNIGVEVLASWPFEHDIDGAGILEGAGKLGETKHLPPTVSLQYHFAPNATFRPYAGIGVNWTIFFSEDTTAALDGALGGPSSLSIDDSFGLALQLGADFDISDNLFLNLNVRYIQIEADATIKTQAAGGEVTSRIKADIDPMVVSAAIGFRF